MNSEARFTPWPECTPGSCRMNLSSCADRNPFGTIFDNREKQRCHYYCLGFHGKQFSCFYSHCCLNSGSGGTLEFNGLVSIFGSSSWVLVLHPVVLDFSLSVFGNSSLRGVLGFEV